MNIEQLQTLVVVADEGGYSRGARALGVSQPAAYQRLQRLEDAVGAPLLRRSGRHMRLTAEGEIVYRRAHEIIRQVRLLSDALAEGCAPSEGASLAVLVGQSLAEFPVPDICIGFQEENPGLIVDFRVTARPPRDIDREISYGRSDVGIHSDPTPVEGLSKLAFYDEEFVAVSCAEHRFQQLEMINPEDFAGESIISYEDPTFTSTQAKFGAWFARGGIEPRKAFISNSVIAIRELVARGVGVSILPREHALQTPGLIVRPIVDAPSRSHFFVTRMTPHETFSTRALREYVVSRAWLEASRTRALSRPLDNEIE